MFVVVTYDVVCDRRRNRIANTLKDYGSRVQYSVFECILGERKFREMLRRLRGLIDEDEDSLRVYDLCGACQRKVRVYGLGEVTHDEDIYVV